MDRLTAAQAAARLGVRTETLYAYVSRGLIARERGSHGSAFDPLEVERFARTRRRSTSPSHGGARVAGADGSPLAVIDTDIALIEDDELWIRGVPVQELIAAPGEPPQFDAVVRWLFERTEHPRAAPHPLVSAGAEAARRMLDALPPGAGAFSRLLAAVAALAAGDPERYDLRPEAVGRVATRLVAGLVDALAPIGDAPGSEAPVAERLWARLSGLPADSGRIRMLDAALILLVDHDMAASTLAARAAASARAHPYAVVAAGLGALDSALHGAVSASVHAMLRDVQQGTDPAAAVAAATRRSNAGIPGFGQPLYPGGDPRARALRDRMAALGDARADAALRIAAEVGDVVRERTGLLPTIDLMLAVMTVAGDMAPDAGETVFAIARSAGWCAHALDEYGRAPLRLRPIGRYVGPDPADVQRASSNARYAEEMR
ncbi:citrate synthase [Microbacterium panaciterrae]|uniref:citrate synthase (unknown stereospecificity) n=1 Tax=Microbacterium panaciterrae TaxID=985759 RepID=A0ABP8P768_9MICO